MSMLGYDHARSYCIWVDDMGTHHLIPEDVVRGAHIRADGLPDRRFTRQNRAFVDWVESITTPRYTITAKGREMLSGVTPYQAHMNNPLVKRGGDRA